MIIQGCPPGLRWWLGRSRHIFGYGAFRQVMSQKLQLGLDMRCAPGRILSGHPPNQAPYAGFDRWATWLACSRLPPPIQAKTLTMPADDCFRLHDQQRRSPVGPETHQPGPEETVARTQFRPLGGLLENCQLLSQCQILSRQIQTRKKPSSQE